MQADLRLEFRSHAWPFNLILWLSEVKHTCFLFFLKIKVFECFLDLLKRKLLHKIKEICKYRSLDGLGRV